MGKSLIIAEKPDLGRNIANAIASTGETMVKQDGFLESESYIITYAFGHLMRLLDIEEYDENYSPEEKVKWTMDNLPFIPDEFRLGLRRDNKTRKTDIGIKKQFGIIKKLLHRKDVDCIYNAGDAGREGEIIVRLILDAAGNTKPVKRLWMPDQTQETILKELDAERPGSDYDNLADEGMARLYVDWVYGINLTRYVSLKTKQLLRVGRVLIPIVKAIYDRDKEIENFKPEDYFIVESSTDVDGVSLTLTSSANYKTMEEAQAAAQKYNEQTTTVSSKTTERKTIGAGKLYSLSKLQGVLAKKYKMQLSESMKIIQGLYEKGYVTYPRTNTEYLSTNEKDKIKAIIRKLQDSGEDLVFKDDKTIFDDKKVEEHSALTPTLKIPDISKLSEKEKNVYNTILNRFMAVFAAESCEVDRTTMVFSVGTLEDITIKGDIYISKGWKKYEDIKSEDKVLPNLNEGDVVTTAFDGVGKQTQPPRPYTTSMLLNYLENPFRTEKQDNDEEEYKALFKGVEIGTEASRTGIIESAIASEYISCVKNVYHIMPTGVYLIESLDKLKIDMSKNKTVELSQALKSVYKEEMSVEDCLQKVADEVHEIFDIGKEIVLPTTGSGAKPSAPKTVIGKCPVCGEDIVEGKKAYGCMGYRNNPSCNFALWKENNKYFDAIGLKMTKKIATDLLQNKKTAPQTLTSKRTGNKYSAIITLDIDENGYPQYGMEFPSAATNESSDEGATVIGQCPICGEDVVESKMAYSCVGYKNNPPCRFTIWKEKNKYFDSIGLKVTKKIATDLIKNKRTAPQTLKSKRTGKKFTAVITLDIDENENIQYGMEFQETNNS